MKKVKADNQHDDDDIFYTILALSEISADPSNDGILQRFS